MVEKLTQVSVNSKLHRHPLEKPRLLDYSDQTVWLMACLSEFIYLPFPEAKFRFVAKGILQQHLKDFLDEVSSEQDTGGGDKAGGRPGDHEFTIEEIYNRGGTRALLLSTHEFLTLVFMGTEQFANTIPHYFAKKTSCASGGCLHSGFNDAYEYVGAEIQQDIKKPEYANRPLMITGYSLGGALATIAAKILKHDGGIAACYTFGSPRVADQEWAQSIETPVYRIVNAFDAVTMIPPDRPLLMTVVCSLPGSIGEYFRKTLHQLPNYSHIGTSLYLTDCKTSRYENVQLMDTESLIRRIGMYQKQFTIRFFRRTLKDHSIIIYRKKLATIARRRSPRPELVHP